MAPSANADVTISFSGSATEGSDFELISPNPVTFPAGSDQNRQIILRVYNDGFVESRESINMQLSLNANGGDATLSNSNTLRHFINDDNFNPDIGTEIVLFEENFESGLSNWTVTGNGTTNFAIGNSTTATSANWSADGNATNFVFVNDDACNCNMNQERIQYNTAIDLSNVNDATLNFDIKYLDSGDQYASDAFVQTSTDNGLTWQNLGSELATYSNWGTASIDMSSLIGESNVLLSFLYNDLGNWAYAMAIDNVSITAQTPAQIFTDTNIGAEAVSARVNDSGVIHVYKEVRGDSNIISSLSTATGTDFGCSDFSISRAGTSGQSHNGSTGANLAMDKQFTFSSETSNAHNTNITFYFTEVEVSGWETAVANAGGSFTRNDLYIERVDGGTTEIVQAIIGAYNGGVTLSGDFNSLDGVFSFAAQSVLSVETSKINQFRVYPNPTNNILYIEGNTNIETIEVVDITGKTIKTIDKLSLKQIELDMTTFTTGIYFVKLTEKDTNNTDTYKILKQ